MPNDYFVKYNPNAKEVVVCVNTDSDCTDQKPTEPSFDGSAKIAADAAAAAAATAAAVAAASPASASAAAAAPAAAPVAVAPAVVSATSDADARKTFYKSICEKSYKEIYDLLKSDSFNGDKIRDLVKQNGTTIQITPNGRAFLNNVNRLKDKLATRNFEEVKNSCAAPTSNDPKQQEILKTIIQNIEYIQAGNKTSIPLGLGQFMGGNSSYYYEKYMKYKAKYLQLQNKNY